MVSQSRRSDTARAALLKAAATEFAARGFDGATVDRIAARARVNKALVYYYFGSKAALYRDILRDTFGAIALGVGAARAEGGPPDRQLRGFVRALAREAIARPHFPGLWLREMADGGRHVDATVVAELRAVLATLAAILEDGRQAGQFRAAPPFLTQLSIVGPLLLFLASAPARTRLAPHLPAAAEVLPDTIVGHVEQAVLAALAPDPFVPAVVHAETRKRRSSR